MFHAIFDRWIAGNEVEQSIDGKGRFLNTRVKFPFVLSLLAMPGFISLTFADRTPAPRWKLHTNQPLEGLLSHIGIPGLHIRQSF
jgi:hypothetical protein